LCELNEGIPGVCVTTGGGKKGMNVESAACLNDPRGGDVPGKGTAEKLVQSEESEDVIRQ